MKLSFAPDAVIGSRCIGLIGTFSGKYFVRQAAITNTHTPEKPEGVFLMSQQTGLDPVQVEQYKKSMLEERFVYDGDERVSGIYQERAGTFYIGEGNHRIAAALEIAQETNNWSPFKKLLAYGHWSPADEAPFDRYKMPSRKSMFDLKWRKFMGALTPSFTQIRR